MGHPFFNKQKDKMKRYLIIIMALLSSITMSAQQKAKYVFYFIGDGMGLAQVCLTEYYQSYKQGKTGSIPVVFSNFPTLGTAVTHSESNYITDSAAAGTALSTGHKTKNGRLGVSMDKKTDFTSISYKIHKAGYKVGITSTVGLNHATPAAFYANSVNRSLYYDIAKQAADCGFELLAGGGFIDSKGENNDQPSVYIDLEKSGYTIIEGMDEFRNTELKKVNKAILIQEDGRDKTELPYAIDRKEGEMTHADIVSASIEYLYDKSGKDGFFIMSEGGKIDWSCHANDAMTTIMEVLSLSDAVQVALDFYNRHPEETLIIVTADHETGGLTLGYESGYNLLFENLETISKSKDKLDDDGKDKVNELTEAARIGWTTSSHTASNVPVYAIGAGSELFSGRMDNTDIPKKICKAMGIEF